MLEFRVSLSLSISKLDLLLYHVHESGSFFGFLVIRLWILYVRFSLRQVMTRQYEWLFISFCKFSFEAKELKSICLFQRHLELYAN